MSDRPVPALSAVVLPDRHPLAGLLADARDAESAGLRGVWTYDHLAWRDLADGPWHAAVPVLAALAGATTAARVGVLVTSPNFRHPVVVAREAVTLDHLAGGRFDLGVGAGGTGVDATALGHPAWAPRERADRFAEWLGLLDLLLRQERTTLEGRWYSARDARTTPGPLQRPLPLTVAAAGPRALRLAARHGARWVTYGPVTGGDDPDTWYAAVEAQGRALDEALELEGRARGDLRRLVLLGLDARWPFEDYPAFLARVAALGTDEVVVHWPRRSSAPADGRGLPAEALPGVLRAHGL